jgi:hypothetical protein
LFYFENLKSSETTIVDLDFIDDEEEKKKIEEGKGYEVAMKLRVKTNENPIKILKRINESVQKFVGINRF